ncbi:uncharacterized protein [Argopecten irradians]|uniref:uncharacterized protein n=1 Tax=Argopecten irradians TaxID=31199 RepID=UPI00370FED3A
MEYIPDKNTFSCHITPSNMVSRCCLVVLVLLSLSLSTCQACNTQQDCGSDECCVTNNPPRGKRMSMSAGHCQTLGHQGSGCLVRYGGGVVNPPNELVYACPCGAGLMCKGIGISEVPLGEMGTCTHH